MHIFSEYFFQLNLLCFNVYNVSWYFFQDIFLGFFVSEVFHVLVTEVLFFRVFPWAVVSIFLRGLVADPHPNTLNNQPSVYKVNGAGNYSVSNHIVTANHKKPAAAEASS